MTQGSVCLVTGASRGIGAAIARQMREANYRVAGTATRMSNLDSAALDLALACDVSDPAQVRETVARVVAELGRIDVLVNNAGIAGTNSMSAPPGDKDETWHRTFDVNVHGPYYMSKAVLPHLPDGSGRIVNVGSVLSLIGVPDASAYAASKHALLGLTRSLALYLARRSITVNLLAPGWVDTDMARERWDALGVTKEQMDATTPLGRVMTPDDVAAWAVFLASERSAGVTGQVITIDGGTLQY